MSEIENANTCARGEELVTYLYGEANASEARDFQSHLKGCHACRAELTTFGSVREGIQSWRAEALHPATVPAMQAQALAGIAQPKAEPPKRSALAALREFLTLSPMWLRGATAFATLLLFALLIVTALHFFNRPDAPVAEKQQQQAPIPTPVAEAPKNESAPAPQEETAVNKTLPDNPAPVAVNHKPERRVVHQRNGRAKANTETGTPSLSNEEQRQLGDLLIAEREHEENVPRLYDLLSESN